MEHSCTCHEMHWRKLPCLHYIAVLHERGVFSSIWDAVGAEYSQGNVVCTCHSITEEENKALDEILNPIEPDVDHVGSDTHVFQNKRGRVTHKSRRVPSVGEFNE